MTSACVSVSARLLQIDNITPSGTFAILLHELLLTRNNDNDAGTILCSFRLYFQGRSNDSATGEDWSAKRSAWCGLRQSQLLILDLRSPYQAPTNKRVAFPSCVTYALNRYTLTHLERASPMILFSIKSETSVTSRFF